MKLIFLGEIRPDCGSIDAFHGYATAARKRRFPLTIADTRKVSPADLARQAARTDFVLFLIEHTLRKNHNALMAAVPPHKRVLVDLDANLTLGEPAIKETLRSHFPIALQPTIKTSNPALIPFPFFGYDVNRRIPRISNKPFDLLYVGNNWFRWREMTTVFDDCLNSAPAEQPRLGLVGKWWSGPSPKRLAYAIFRDHGYLTRNRIITHPAVPHSRLFRQMSLGRVNAVLQRHIFRTEKVITPRIFETLAADTIPLFYLPSDVLLHLFGSPALPFLPFGKSGFGRRFADMLSRPQYYRKHLALLRKIARDKHSYDTRLTDLIYILRQHAS